MASGAAYAAGIAGIFQGLAQGVQQRDQRNLQKATTMAQMTHDEWQMAQQRALDMPGNTEAAQAAGKAADAYEKSMKEIQKYAKVDPPVWSKIRQAIDSAVQPKKKSQVAPNQAPAPVASGPAGAPAAQQPSLNENWMMQMGKNAGAKQESDTALTQQRVESGKQNLEVGKEQVDEITARRAVVKAVHDFYQDKDYNKALETIRKNAGYGFKAEAQETLAEMSLLDVAQQMGVQVPDAENRRKALKEQYEMETKQRQQVYKASPQFAKIQARVPNWDPEKPRDQQTPEAQASYDRIVTQMNEEDTKKIDATVKAINRRSTGTGGKPATVKPFGKAVTNIYRESNMMSGQLTKPEDKMSLLRQSAATAIEQLKADGVNMSDRIDGESDLDYLIRKSYTEGGQHPPASAPAPTSGFDQVVP